MTTALKLPTFFNVAELFITKRYFLQNNRNQNGLKWTSHAPIAQDNHSYPVLTWKGHYTTICCFLKKPKKQFMWVLMCIYWEMSIKAAF